MAGVGTEPPSPYDGPPGADPSYGLAASDRAVRPEDIANLGYENAHILSRLLGPQPAPPSGPAAKDPTQAMLVAALMAQKGNPPDRGG